MTVMSKLVSELKVVDDFMNANFGAIDVLLNKNRGLFPSRRIDLKNSRIKGYMFHGYSCFFQFSSFGIDVDLDEDRPGITYKTIRLYMEHNGISMQGDQLMPLIREHLEKGILYQHGESYWIK